MQSPKENSFARWRDAMSEMPGPAYAQIVDLLRQDLRAGLLMPGDALPSHRELAQQLGINFTTVTRGYEEAKKLNLVQARRGQGTFIAGEKAMVSNGLEVPAQRLAGEPIDLTSTWPPNLEIASTLAAQVHLLTQQRSFDFLARRGGTVPALDLAAGQAWLQERFPDPISGRLCVASGTRNALIALLASLVGSGGTLLVEALIWPTVGVVAGLLGINLIPVAIDAQGLVPEALDAACGESRAKVLYCVPTMQNPSGAVMGLQRRRDIIEVARRRGLTMVEDDAYSALLEAPPPSLSALAPDITFCVIGLAKLISPSMRVSYVVAPDQQRSTRLAELLRVTMQTAAPLEAALATRLIETGLLRMLIGQVSAEARLRQDLTLRILSGHDVTAPQGGLFAWLALPDPWINSGFVGRLRQDGVLVANSNSFVVNAEAAPNAVRIATGAANKASDLEFALTKIKDLLRQNPSLLNPID